MAKRKPQLRLTKVARAVITDVIALVAILILGAAMSGLHHIPLAITPLQALGLELLVLAYPVAMLRYDPGKHKVRDTHDRQVIFELVAFGLAAAALAYASYLAFFIVHSLSPAYIDTGNPLYREASTVALFTIALCQRIHLAFLRVDADKHFSRKAFLGRHFLRAWVITAFLLLNFAYDPLFQAVFHTEALSVLGLLTAVFFAGVYFGLKLLQRHSREHTRHTVAELHRQLGKLPRA